MGKYAGHEPLFFLMVHLVLVPLVTSENKCGVDSMTVR